MLTLLDAPDVVMAHLQRHNIRVEVGDRVGRGQQPWRVRNSDCDEPHLHDRIRSASARS